nr:unnamed protein product [Callosobruchus analis]
MNSSILKDIFEVKYVKGALAKPQARNRCRGLTMVPLKIVTVFVSAACIVTGIGIGAMGFGIESLQTTFVSDTKEFITGPGNGLAAIVRSSVDEDYAPGLQL